MLHLLCFQTLIVLLQKLSFTITHHFYPLKLIISIAFLTKDQRGQQDRREMPLDAQYIVKYSKSKIRISGINYNKF